MPITTCDSPETLRVEFDTIRKKVTLDETEDTWDTISQGIIYLTRLCNNGGCEFPSEMVTGVRLISRPLNSALNSERSRLSGAAIELVTTLSIGLGSSFEPLLSLFVPALLALCGRTNKIFTSRAKACILAIVQQTRLPSLLPYLAEMANHKSVFPRLTAAEAILACLNCFNPPDLEKEARARIIEDFIKLTARDASADVRKASKEVFKAYKTLMPGRVDNFVAPLTPVVKKYLDIQTGPSGVHGVIPSAGQKQSSRPPSRTNSKATESGQRPTTSILSKPASRPATDDSAHNPRQRPAARVLPTGIDARIPRQGTMPQMQRDPPQPRQLHANAPPPSVAQRAVPTSAPHHPPPGAVRVPPSRNTSSTGPQRPPPMQIKFNPPPDRLKLTGNGAKRVPLPSASVNGNAGEQVAATANSADRAGSVVDKTLSKLPNRNAEAMPSGKLVSNRKGPEGTRSTSSVTKPPNGSALVATTASQRPRKPLAKSDGSHRSRLAPPQRPARNVQKGARPLVRAGVKVTSPLLIPLPPSRSTSPTEIPLPPSPDCTSHPADPEAQGESAVTAASGPPEPTSIQLGSVESHQEQGGLDNPSTPITTLLASIQRGFLFTPSSPLSPPQNYLLVPPGDVSKRQQGVIVSELGKGPVAGIPLCSSLEGASATDGLNRYALKDLN